MRGSWNTVPDIPVRFGDPPILALDKQPGYQSRVGWSRGISAPSSSSARGHPVKQYYFL